MLLTITVCILSLLTFWIWRIKNYWKFNNIPYLPSGSILGNFGELFLFKRSFPDVLTDLYNSEEMKKYPFFGIRIFYKPAILIKDRELIKRILVKDFNYFHDRFATADKNHDQLGYYNVFTMRNPEWKIMKQRTTPIFTPAKMKKVFFCINAIGKDLNNFLCSENLDPKTNFFTVEAKDICSRYTIDIVGAYGYGIEGNAIKDPNSPLRQCANSIFAPNNMRAIEFGCCFFFSEILGLFRFKFLSKETNKFMQDVIPGIVKQREENGVVIGDFLGYMLNLKQEDKDKSAATKGDFVFRDEMIVAQSGAFLIGGFETSSTTLSFCMYELAKNPLVQNKLKEEIDEMFTENIKNEADEISYEIVQKMEYLNMVFQEATRMYPPNPYLERRCVSDYSLEPFHNFVVKKNTQMIIPICAIQRDPNYFPNPTQFDPERFSQENKINILPYTLMSFGNGPRRCLGEALGTLITKLGLIYLLKNHFYSLSEKMDKEMSYDRKTILLSSLSGIHLNVFRDEKI